LTSGVGVSTFGVSTAQASQEGIFSSTTTLLGTSSFGVSAFGTSTFGEVCVFGSGATSGVACAKTSSGFSSKFVFSIMKSWSP
jgi:hypothetical protein